MSTKDHIWALGFVFPAATLLATPGFSAGPTVGAPTLSPSSYNAFIGRTAAITATSSGFAQPQYKFIVTVPGTGAVTQPCGDYSASKTCSFTPSIAGAFKVQVQVRESTSTASYDAQSAITSYVVMAGTCTVDRNTGAVSITDLASTVACVSRGDTKAQLLPQYGKAYFASPAATLPLMTYAFSSLGYHDKCSGTTLGYMICKEGVVDPPTPYTMADGLPKSTTDLAAFIAQCASTASEAPDYLKNQSQLAQWFSACSASTAAFAFPADISKMAAFATDCFTAKSASPIIPVTRLADGLQSCVNGEAPGGGGSSSIDPAFNQDCGGGPLLSQSPVSLNQISGLLPLGNFAPPGHIFPTRHIYYVMKNDQWNDPIPTNVYAPARVGVYKIVRSARYEAIDGSPGRLLNTDYRIYFRVCSQVDGYFLLVNNLSTGFKDQLLAHGLNVEDESQYACDGTNSGGYQCGCTFENGDGVSIYKSCIKSFKRYVEVLPGAQIGRAGLTSNESGGSPINTLDFSLSDSRVQNITAASPQKAAQQDLHVVCPIDYYDQNSQIAQQTKSMFGNPWENATRQIGPVCGKVDWDLPNTARGCKIS